MPTATGTIQIVSTSTTTSLRVKKDPPEDFPHPLPAWVLEKIEGREGKAIEVEWNDVPEPPPPTKQIAKITVG